MNNVVNNIAGEGPRRPVTGFFSSGVKSVADSGVVFFVLTIIFLILFVAATLYKVLFIDSMGFYSLMVPDSFLNR